MLGPDPRRGLYAVTGRTLREKMKTSSKKAVSEIIRNRQLFRFSPNRRMLRVFKRRNPCYKST